MPVGYSFKRYREGEMGVVEAKIQTVEDMYRLLWTAVANKQPISAIYKDLPRLFCPHRLGVTGPSSFAFCAINMAGKVKAVWRQSAHLRIGAV